jgi:hypothetical protein
VLYHNHSHLIIVIYSTAFPLTIITTTIYLQMYLYTFIDNLISPLNLNYFILYFFISGVSTPQAWSTGPVVDVSTPRFSSGRQVC